MIRPLQTHLDQALQEYTSGDHYQILLEAKQLYFSMTGEIFEDDDDYETRMNGFNDWYLLQFLPRNGVRTVIKDYLIKNNVDGTIGDALLNINHSIFENRGQNSKKQMVLKDLLHNSKLTLSNKDSIPALLKSDIFIGRTITHDRLHYIMMGLRVFPKDAGQIIKRESNRVRKLNDPNRQEAFLFQLENLKTKWKRYGHIDVSRIFKFDK